MNLRNTDMQKNIYIIMEVVGLRKEITATIYVEINGENHRWDDLTEQRQKEISIELNRRAMESIGYRIKEKTA